MTGQNRPDRIDPSVLIAVDGSSPSQRAVDYTYHLTRLIPGLRLVLLHIMPRIPPVLRSEAKAGGPMYAKLKQLEAANRKQGEGILERARKNLLAYGVDPSRIETRLRPRHSGLAKDIINEAEMRRFDALVIGRRGLTRAQEIFMGSVSNQLIQHAANVPLWIVDGKVADPRVLAAIDGSPAGLRVVDHVAFMLGSDPKAEVDFVHVVPKFQPYCPIDFSAKDNHWEGEEENLQLLEEDFRNKTKNCIDNFKEKAITILRQAGFSADRIRFEQREITLGVARTIIKAAKEGGFGAIAVGRRGFDKSPFLGSVGDRVIRRAEDLAVWLVG